MYAPKYISEFDKIGDTVNSPNYRVEIHEQNWGGGITKITHAGAPVLHSYQTDDLFQAIKGSTLTLNYIDIDLEDFIADSDFNFKVFLYRGRDLLFAGYLMQDDYTEQITEVVHESTLTATDALGVLKQRNLNENESMFILTGETQINLFAVNRVENSITFNKPDDMGWVSVGNRIQIYSYDIPLNEIGGTYHITGMSSNSDKVKLILSEPIPGTFPVYEADARFYIPLDLFQQYSIGTILQACISVTQLNLKVNYWGTLAEGAGNDLFSSVFIDCKSFLKNHTEFKTCYEVLDIILSRLNISLFQSRGAWNLVRWGEFPVSRYTQYDADFTNPFAFAADTPINDYTLIYGAVRGFIRQFKEVIHQFDFKPPQWIIRNLDLLEVGRVVSTSTRVVEGETQYITEYNALYWTLILPSLPGAKCSIFVIRDANNIEIDRYLVAQKSNVATQAVWFNKDDIFDLSFNYRSKGSARGNANIVNGLLLMGPGGVNKSLASNSLDNPNGGLGWQTVYNAPLLNFFWYSSQWGPETNAKDGISMSIDNTNAPIPYDGQFIFGINASNVTREEDQYRDIKLSYKFKVARTTMIVGQQHKQERPLNILNSQSETFNIDTAPKFQISGVLYIENNVLATKFKTNKMSDVFLGEIVSKEIIRYQSKTRQTIEGDIIGDIDALTVLKDGDRYHAPTSIEIDYKKSSVNAKFVEIYSEIENDNSQYEFKYLYKS